MHTHTRIHALILSYLLSPFREPWLIRYYFMDFLVKYQMPLIQTSFPVTVTKGTQGELDLFHLTVPGQVVEKSQCRESGAVGHISRKIGEQGEMKVWLVFSIFCSPGSQPSERCWLQLFSSHGPLQDNFPQACPETDLGNTTQVCSGVSLLGDSGACQVDNLH